MNTFDQFRAACIKLGDLVIKDAEDEADQAFGDLLVLAEQLYQDPAFRLAQMMLCYRDEALPELEIEIMTEACDCFDESQEVAA